MKKSKRILAMLLLLFLSGIVLAFAAKNMYSLERKACFKQLSGYTEQVASEIKKTFDRDRSDMVRLADMLAQCDLTDSKKAGKVLSSLVGTSIASRLELLLPENELLHEDGSRTDATGVLSFQQEAAAGAHISRRSGDADHPESLILRHYVPVKQNGQTTALLCGVMELDQFSQLFSVKEYGEDMQLYIIEGKTGDFLQDTWHEHLGNASDLGTRKIKEGYRWDEFESDLAQGRPGEVVFLSNNSRDYFYSYYAPAGIEDWMVTLTVPEKAAFAQAEKILHSFYALAALLLSVFLLYFVWMLWDIRKENAVREKQLRYVSYMLGVEKELFDAHIQPEHFTAALQKTADFLTAEVAFFWLVDELPEVQRHLWSNRQEQSNELNAELSELFPGLFSILQKKGGLVGYDGAELLREFPVGGQQVSRFGIQNLMLTPVTGLDGELAMILGACNMKHRWKNTEPLEQVSLSFSMAMNHYGAYQALSKMGRMDSLTGLMNRNSYHAALSALSKEEHRSFACVYIDVNGLHEINNHMGHQAGDKMLKTVAEKLQGVFSKEAAYRIGGDEFVALCTDRSEQEVRTKAEQLRKEVEEQHYRLSLGLEWRNEELDFKAIVDAAETAMQKDKQRYYQEKGNERQMRALDQHLEQLLVEKQDADTFLSTLAPEFKGVYFVDLKSDTIRHLYIPPYFEKMLQEAEDKFSQALILYARRIVKAEYFCRFERFCDYDYLEARLGQENALEFTYQKVSGEWLKLRVLKFKSYTEKCRETLWIFTNLDRLEGDPNRSAEADL